jgi:hypothetical protein
VRLCWCARDRQTIRLVGGAQEKRGLGCQHTTNLVHILVGGGIVFAELTRQMKLSDLPEPPRIRDSLRPAARPKAQQKCADKQYFTVTGSRARVGLRGQEAQALRPAKTRTHFPVISQNLWSIQQATLNAESCELAGSGRRPLLPRQDESVEIPARLVTSRCGVMNATTSAGFWDSSRTFGGLTVPTAVTEPFVPGFAHSPGSCNQAAGKA